MDPREYVDARWSALIRAAVLLGATEADAPAVVQRVLDDNERRIRRSKDPDPLIHRALAAAIPGGERTAFAAEADPLSRQEMLIEPAELLPDPPPTSRARRRWPVAVAALAGLAVVGVVLALSRPDPPPTDHLDADQVPSLFGYAAPAARDLLEERGLKVVLEPFSACETLGRVVASDPAIGTSFQSGDAITVYTSRPASVECLPNYTDRVLAWQLLDFANGRGPAPQFAGRVFVYADGAPATVLTADAAADPDRWDPTGVLTTLRRASGQVRLVDDRPPTYAIPAINVSRATDDRGRCGVPETSVAGSADAIALQILAPIGTGCPVRVDIYRNGPSIEAIALYPTPSWSD